MKDDQRTYVALSLSVVHEIESDERGKGVARHNQPLLKHPAVQPVDCLDDRRVDRLALALRQNGQNAEKRRQLHSHNALAAAVRREEPTDLRGIQGQLRADRVVDRVEEARFEQVRNLGFLGNHAALSLLRRLLQRRRRERERRREEGVDLDEGSASTSGGTRAPVNRVGGGEIVEEEQIHEKLGVERGNATSARVANGHEELRVGNERKVVALRGEGA